MIYKYIYVEIKITFCIISFQATCCIVLYFLANWETDLISHLAFFWEAGQFGLVPTRPLSQLGLGSTRPGQLGLFNFLMVNRDITYVPNKKFGRYNLEYAK